MGNEGLWRIVRRRVMPALVSVAALLVSIAAVVFIVDTVRDGDDDGGDRVALRLGGELPQRVQALSGGPLLGIQFSEEDGAVVVEDVVPGSPADEAGFEPGDVIERVDGEPVSSGAELREAIAAVEPGEDYRVTVNRGGRHSTLEVERPTVAVGEVAPGRERPFEEVPVPRVAPLDPGEASGAPLIGVTTEDGDDGVRVASVMPGLGAEQAGIEPGDLLLAINGEPIASTAELRELLRDAEAGDEVRLLVAHDGAEQQVRVTLSPAPLTRFQFRVPEGNGGRFEPRPDGSFQFRGPDGEDLAPLLEGLPPELQERLARIIEELIQNGVEPRLPRGDGQVPGGA